MRSSLLIIAVLCSTVVTCGFGVTDRLPEEPEPCDLGQAELARLRAQLGEAKRREARMQASLATRFATADKGRKSAAGLSHGEVREARERRGDATEPSIPAT